MLTTNGWLKQLKSLAIASAGAALTYAIANIGHLDLGQLTPVVVALSSVLANVVKTWLEERKADEPYLSVLSENHLTCNRQTTELNGLNLDYWKQQNARLAKMKEMADLVLNENRSFTKDELEEFDGLLMQYMAMKEHARFEGYGGAWLMRSLNKRTDAEQET